MLQLSTKEHLVYFMQCGMMRLSNYDVKFVQNLHHLLNIHKPITTNQVALLEKLIVKYQRQLNKHNYPSQLVNSLPWHSTIIQSEPAFTDAFISISENKITFKAPFNKNFITTLRSIDDTYFKWNRDVKIYEADFGTAPLLIITTLAPKFYSVINHCSITTELLNTVSGYTSARFWNPTLVKTHDRYIIAASNHYLDKALQDIELNINPNTLSLLSLYGVSVDNSLVQENPLLKFASEYYVEVELSALDELINWLTELGCDHVYTSGLPIGMRKEFQNKLSHANIALYNYADPNIDKVTPAFPVVLQFTSVLIEYKIEQRNIKKIIKIKNSTPVNIK
jgi:hypothetical protein